MSGSRRSTRSPRALLGIRDRAADSAQRLRRGRLVKVKHFFRRKFSSSLSSRQPGGAYPRQQPRGLAGPRRIPGQLVDARRATLLDRRQIPELAHPAPALDVDLLRLV